jgi:tRNA1(Val) A37 N6-methylase TrmN6
MIAEGEPLATSEDAVLGGRLVLRQPLRGHRVGHDAILLAAATAARAGEHAVDLGAGVGAAGLALARRVEGLTVSLVEIDPALGALASGNARRNGLHERVTVVACNAEDSEALAAAGLGGRSADRVLMNPPFRDAARENVSPDPRRRLAHVAAPGALPRWIASATALLKPGGVLTLIWPADRLDDVLAALADDYGALGVLPVFPRPDKPAIRVLVRAARGETAGRTDHPPLVLNDASGRPTAAAEAVLRGGGILSLAAM